MRKRYYSHDEERYFQEDLENAVDECLQNCPGEFPEKITLYTGLGEQKKISEYFSVDSLVERIVEECCEEAGEFSETYCFNLEKQDFTDLEIEVKKTLNAWADKFAMQPTFFVIDPVNEIFVFLEWDKNGRWTIKEGGSKQND